MTMTRTKKTGMLIWMITFQMMMKMKMVNLVLVCAKCFYSCITTNFAIGLLHMRLSRIAFLSLLPPWMPDSYRFGSRVNDAFGTVDSFHRTMLGILIINVKMSSRYAL